MTFAHPQYLVETDWLATHLTDPELRVLDCTVLFATDEHGVSLAHGREAWRSPQKGKNGADGGLANVLVEAGATVG